MPPSHAFDYWGALLTTLKFLGVLVAGAGAIVAAAPAKPDKETASPPPKSKLGRIANQIFRKETALRWAVVGLVVSFCSQSVETIKASRENDLASAQALRQTHAAQVTLENLRRLQFWQSPGSLEGRATFSLANSFVAKDLSWIARIPRNARSNLIAGFPGIVVTSKSFGSDTPRFFGEICQIQVRAESPYHPLQQPQTTLSELFEHTIVYVRLRRPTNFSSGAALHLLENAHTASDIWNGTSEVGRAVSNPGTGEFYVDLVGRTASFELIQPLAISGSLHSLKDKDFKDTLISVVASQELDAPEGLYTGVAAAVLRTAKIDQLRVRIEQTEIALDKLDNGFQREFPIEDGHVSIYALPSSDGELTNILHSSLDP
jgi:hypothetical protein